MDQEYSEKKYIECGSKQMTKSTPKRILVVDDGSCICALNSKVLSQYGYQVDAVKDGVSAWEALMESNYDLLITDNSMPKVTGMELLKKVRAAHMAMPVILATGTVPMEEITQNDWLQPATILPKPYTAEQLLRKVKEFLRASS